MILTQSVILTSEILASDSICVPVVCAHVCFYKNNNLLIEYGSILYNYRDCHGSFGLDIIMQQHDPAK